MAASTIIFTDIVGYSKGATVDQLGLVKSLNTEVKKALKGLFDPAKKSPDVIILPTGDGMALIFLHKHNQKWDRGTLLDLILRLHLWAHGAGAIQLRVGVHTGVIEQIKDINGLAGVCGTTINYTQRVMDAASPKQTLFSEAAIGELFGKDIRIPIKAGNVVSFQGPIEVVAKHGLQIPVFKLVTETAVPWHTNEDPIAKHLMTVGLTKLPKEIKEWSPRLGTARRVALVQLTGERLLATLEGRQTKFSNRLERLWVFMPNPAQFNNLSIPQSAGSKLTITEGMAEQYIKKWAAYLQAFHRQHPAVDVKLGVFDLPFYFGASCLNWDLPKGLIHISPCIWGKHSTQWPGYELEWLGSRPAEIYKTYSDALDYLNACTENRL